MSKKETQPDVLDVRRLARRAFLQQASYGLGGLALWHLLGLETSSAAGEANGTAHLGQGVLGAPHFPPSAKRVIYLHMYGAVSHVDSFDYCPELERMHGQQIPPSVMGEGRVSTMVKGQTRFPLVRNLRPFAQHGECGAWVSELFPFVAEIVDDLCFVKSMHTDQVNHNPAAQFFQSGFQLAGRPSIGAWLHYGLGTDNDNLPAYIVMNTMGPGMGQNIDSGIYGSGFLPSHFQGVQFMNGEEPVHHVGIPAGLSSAEQGEDIEAIIALARAQQDISNDPEISSRIQTYEMAYRMQSSVPEVTDISSEPSSVLDMYGPDVMGPGFARNCLLARRLVERDVKFVQLFHNGWDAHFEIELSHPEMATTVDQPVAALVKDLKQRGLLEDTLVIFGSEFGRTPFSQGDINNPASYGRDHHPYAFTYWLAGGGVNAGYTHGASDDFGYNIVQDPVHVHDFNATLLRLLGIDHERLTFRFQGRDYRLTDVHGHVVEDILA